MTLSPSDMAPVFALLARMFLHAPNEQLLQEVAKPRIADAFEGLEPGFIPYVREGPWGAPELEALVAEYERLLVRPEGVPPCAAFWMEGEDAAAQTKLKGDIANLYALLRMRPTERSTGPVPDDHIGMLLSMTSVALRSDPSGELANTSVGLYEAWAPQFAAKVLRTSESPLYRAAARLLLDLLGQPPPAR